MKFGEKDTAVGFGTFCNVLEMCEKEMQRVADCQSMVNYREWSKMGVRNTIMAVSQPILRFLYNVPFIGYYIDLFTLTVSASLIRFGSGINYSIYNYIKK